MSRNRILVFIQGLFCLLLLACQKKQAPQITSAPIETALVGNAYEYDVDAVDADSSRLMFTLKTHPDTMTMDQESGRISWTPRESDQGSVPVVVRVEDEEGLSDEQSFTITVRSKNTNPNQAPQARARDDQSVEVGALVQLDGSASTDPDKDALNYRWSMTQKPAGSQAALSDTTRVNPSFTADLSGEYKLSLWVNDGALDSAADVVHVCTPNFTETSGQKNDPYLQKQVEPTGLTLLANSRIVISGSFEDSASNPAWSDSDGYAFTLARDMLVQAQLQGSTNHIRCLAILGAKKQILGWWGFSNQKSVWTNSIQLPAGSYIVHTAIEPAVIANPIPYSINITSRNVRSCPAGTEAPAYAEKDESPQKHRGNDMVSVTWSGFPHPSATSNPADNPELTGLVLNRASSTVTQGSMASVDALDDFLDRDTFVVTTGGSHRLAVRIDYPKSDVNMDLYIFPAGNPSQLLGAAAKIDSTTDQLTAEVLPYHSYWIWVGTRDERRIGENTDLPVDYRISICTQ
jgi:hypothetical protein